MNEHKSRFKSYLISSREVEAESERVGPLLRTLNSLSGKLSDPEKVLLFIFIFAESRNPNNWYISRGNFACSIKKEGFLFSNLPEEFSFLRKILANNLEDFCNRYDFKKLPGAVMHAIHGWKLGTHKLVLKDAPITPLEMLAAQARGERIVTLNMQAALAGRQVDGQRDALEFLLHDLVHADLFFGEDHSEQVRFFNKFHDVFVGDPKFSGFFAEAMRANSEFSHDIHYLMSDMNSHVGHMQAYLRASLIKQQLFTEQKAADETLSVSGSDSLEHRWTLLNNLVFS